jgi:hypothetical protein
MADKTEALMARGDWNFDPGSTHHRKIRKPSSRRQVPTEDVHSCFKKAWNVTPTPENPFVPAGEESPWHTKPPSIDDSAQMETSFSEWMSQVEE